jgi:polar amino acid transport system permease protein
VIRSFTTGELVYLVMALRWTVALSAIAFVGGAVLGLAAAVLRVAPGRIGPLIAAGYIQLFHGTPLLMQMFVIYFGLSLFGLDLTPLVSAGLALTLFAGAYLGEIWRGCLAAVPRAQWESATALGLGFLQQVRLVILPQAVPIAIPPTVGMLVQLVKSTSLAAIVGFVELTRAGQIVNNATFQPLTVFGVVGGLYFLLCFPLSRWSRSLERRLRVAR